MLEITDARSGLRTRAARGGLLALHEHLALPGGVITAEDMRVLVVGDVLLRSVEMNGGQVTLRCAVQGDIALPDGLAPFRRTISGLGVHPPAEVITDRGVRGAAGGAPAVRVSADEPPDDDPAAWLRIGPVLEPPADLSRWAQGEDASAVRLALLARPHESPVSLASHELAGAGRELQRWRSLVAHWATRPSRPVPADIRRTADAAMADDLGTPAVLELLRAVEAADDLPDGAKFETFALLDGVLGLDLACGIGQDGALSAAG